MRKKQLTMEQINNVLKEIEEGNNVKEVATRYGVHFTTVYTWIKENKKDEIKGQEG